MGKRVLLFLIFFLIIVAIAYFVFFDHKKNYAPKRLSTIPKSATWFGGPDGGSWILLKKIMPGKVFEINIYNEDTGLQESNTDFKLSPNCNLEELDSVTILKNIEAYDGKDIILKINADGKHCFLTPL
jgi:hypothetical protein